MKCVVLLSGGLDSSTLAVEMSSTHEVLALSFDYGAKHNERELRSAKEIADIYSFSHKIVNLRGALFGGALMGVGEIPHAHYSDETQKQTVVSNRNMVLLSVAASYAIGVGANVVAYACHAGDADVYPDCRPAFVEQMAKVLTLCDYSTIELRTPFITWTKRDIARRAVELGVPVDLTYSCYEGAQFPCGECGACRSREEALK